MLNLRFQLSMHEARLQRYLEERTQNAVFQQTHTEHLLCLIIQDMLLLLCSVLSVSLWPMDCSPPDFSGHGISQARILEWVATSSSRGSSWPRDWTSISCIGRQIPSHCTATIIPNWVKHNLCPHDRACCLDKGSRNQMDNYNAIVKSNVDRVLWEHRGETMSLVIASHDHDHF